MDFGDIIGNGLLAATGPTAIAYAIAALGLNLQFGHAGLLNFGPVAFMLLGAYGTAITVEQGGPLWLGIIVGIACGGVLGLLLGIPTLRLRADYLAMTTIAVAEIIRLFVRSSWGQPLTNGVFGIQGFADDFHSLTPWSPSRVFDFGLFSVTGARLWVMTVGWVLVVVCGLFIHRLVKSPWGRLIKAIREDEDAAASLGKNVFARKLQVLVIGGLLGGLAGILPALEAQRVGPESYTTELTFFLYAIVILGGMGTIWGPVLGAVLFQFLWFSLDEFMSQAHENFDVVSSVLTASGAAQVRVVLLGVGMMLLLAFRPQGILGNKEEALFGD